MLSERVGAWVPVGVGAVCLLLAIEKIRWLVVAPADLTQEFLLGIELRGRLAWMASVLLMLLLAWISAASFRRRRQAAWAVMGYCMYLTISYWVWLAQYSPHSLQTKLVSGAFFMGMMLATCRFLFDRRGQFDQQ
jgi:hypothetical protein